MQTRILPDVARALAQGLHARLQRGGNFGFPTGRTMDPVYAALCELHARAPIDAGRVRGFMVDEYVGLEASDPRSYSFYLQRRVFGPLGISRVHRVTQEGYDELIAGFGGLDLQLLGLGRNGHIGFNEPGSPKDSRTRLVQIAELTREANAGLFRSIDEVPTHAISIGVQTILRAKEVWVIATGPSKAAIVRQLAASAETPELPASFLKSHTNCTLWLDEAAAAVT